MLCWNCLAKGHGIKQCQSKVTCRVDGCRKRHHTLLHETKKVIASQSIAEEEEVAQNNSIQSTVIQSKTYLQVLPVILSNDSYSVRPNALLDCRTDSSLVREDIAKILQLKGEQKLLKIPNAFLDSGQIESKLVNFKISSSHHPLKIQITKACSIPNLLIPHTSYLPSSSSSDITVLISAKMAHLLIHEEYKAGKENEPYTVGTKLGWVLIAGKSSKLEKSVTNNVCLVYSIDEINLEQFWNIENHGILSKNDPKMLIRDETRAMNILQTTTT